MLYCRPNWLCKYAQAHCRCAPSPESQACISMTPRHSLTGNQLRDLSTPPLKRTTKTLHFCSAVTKQPTMKLFNSFPQTAILEYSSSLAGLMGAAVPQSWDSILRERIPWRKPLLFTHFEECSLFLRNSGNCYFSTFLRILHYQQKRIFVGQDFSCQHAIVHIEGHRMHLPIREMDCSSPHSQSIFYSPIFLDCPLRKLKNGTVLGALRAWLFSCRHLTTSSWAKLGNKMPTRKQPCSESIKDSTILH